jgi:hypothetical protein
VEYDQFPLSCTTYSFAFDHLKFVNISLTGWAVAGHLCQGFCPNFTTPLPPGDAKKISQVYRSIVNRARTCTEGCKHDSTVEPNRWKGSNITAVVRSAVLSLSTMKNQLVEPDGQPAGEAGKNSDTVDHTMAPQLTDARWRCAWQGLKDASTLLAMTALHEWASLTGVELYVVMVIRDGRDLVLGASDGAHDSLERAMGSLDDAGGFHGDAYRVHAWAQSYKQRHECMQPTLGAHLVPMRMEDFAVNETNARKAAAAQLLLSLHVPFDDAKLDELSAVMAVPIDAPADFLSSHYGRWEQVRACVCVCVCVCGCVYGWMNMTPLKV